jgi:hypothetical protein
MAAALPNNHKLRLALNGMTASQHMQAHVHATGGIWPVGRLFKGPWSRGSKLQKNMDHG